MAHFAKLADNNMVLSIHVLNNEVIADGESESETKGIEFLTNIHGHTKWKQTSFNTTANTHTLGGTPLRKNYAEVGSVYDPDNDAFIPNKPYGCESWTLNVIAGTFVWESPLKRPTAPNTESIYLWEDSKYQANNQTGWFLYAWNGNTMVKIN